MNLKMPTIFLRHVKNNSEEPIVLVFHGNEWTIEPGEEQFINIPLVPCSSPDEYHENKFQLHIGQNIHNLWMYEESLRDCEDDEYNPDAPEIVIENYQSGKNIKLICTDVDILGEVDDE